MSLVSKTIGTCLHERAEAMPDLQGIGYRDYWYSWKDVDEISDFLAVRYWKMGIRHGVHAATWSVNSPNLVFLPLCALEDRGRFRFSQYLL